MKGLEERINELERAAEDIERLAKAKNTEGKDDETRRLATRGALVSIARQLDVAIRHEKMGVIPTSARSLLGPSVFKHSTLGTTRGITSDFDYYQTSGADIRGGQRFMDMFAKRFIGTNTTTRRIRPVPSGPGAGDVNEGEPKSTRQYAFNETDFPFSKLAVTDTITQEIVIADSGERAANFIVDALAEHVKDVLNQRLINYLASNGTAFNSAQFAAHLNIPAGTGARWHDLVAAAQLQFEQTFADHFLDIKYGDILLAPIPVYWGILQDRKGAGLDLYYGDISPLGNLSLEAIWKDYSGSRLILAHTEGLTIELVDDVQIYYNRVVDEGSERNLFRVTVEVYYRFVPAKQPLPAIVSDNPLADLQALTPYYEGAVQGHTGEH
jgi:hypothetical protein